MAKDDKTPGAGKNETEARMCFLLGALLYHHSKFTNIPVSKLIDVAVMPTLENESIARQVDLTHLILRGEAQARAIAIQIEKNAPTMEPRLSRTKDWRLD